jgi:hypothetical protein
LQDLVGLTIAKILTVCHADYADLTMIDEPPGRLQAVEIVCRAPDHTDNFLLDVSGNLGLFSEGRDWSERDVLKLRVRRVARTDRGWLP